MDDNDDDDEDVPCVLGLGRTLATLLLSLLLSDWGLLTTGRGGSGPLAWSQHHHQAAPNQTAITPPSQQSTLAQHRPAAQQPRPPDSQPTPTLSTYIRESDAAAAADGRVQIPPVGDSLYWTALRGRASSPLSAGISPAEEPVVLTLSAGNPAGGHAKTSRDLTAAAADDDDGDGENLYAQQQSFLQSVEEAVDIESNSLSPGNSSSSNSSLLLYSATSQCLPSSRQVPGGGHNCSAGVLADAAVQICRLSGGERLAALLHHPDHPSVCWQHAQGQRPFDRSYTVSQFLLGTVG